MHVFINVCRCCLESNTPLRSYSIKNEDDYGNPKLFIKEIKTIYPYLQLNDTFPLQLCNDCQRLMFEATKMKQYLDHQEGNEDTQKLLLKDDICSGCLERCTYNFTKILDINVYNIYHKDYIDLIKDAVPHYKMDSCISYKYCKKCIDFIKSLYLLKALIIANNSKFEKYCFSMLSKIELYNPKFSQLSISLQKILIHYSDANSKENAIKEDICKENYIINFKTEIDECNYNVLTYTEQNYPFSEQLQNEEIFNQDDEIPINIFNENEHFQDSPTSKNILDPNNQLSTVSRANGELKEDENKDTKKSYECNYCYKLFEYKSDVESGKCNTIEKPYKCNNCTKSFSLKIKQKFYESLCTSEKYKCTYCPKAFISKQSFRLHERIHTREKAYKCKYCTKSFNQSNHLINHERIHTGEKPFKCTLCSKSFNQRSYLTLHEKLHTGEKPYKCTFCPKSFVFRKNRKFHESQHTHTGENPYKCNYCSKSFILKYDHKIHEKIHTGEKPYQCKMCSNSFLRKCHLISHEKIHTGERPYQCKVCSKSFLRKFHLIIHERIHTGEKPFQCKVCTKAFRAKSTLIQHEKSHSSA